MPKAITIKIENVILKGEFNDTAAGQAMADALPIECQWSRWGEEYYGSTRPAFSSYPGTSSDLMEVGDLAYYAQNGWFCLFFGPTPASRGKEPRAAVPVQKVGRVAGDWPSVKTLAESVKALIEAA